MGLQIAVRKSGHATILDLRGRIAAGADADSFRAQLRGLAENAPRDVLVNLAGVTQIDSSGVGALVGSYVTLTRGGGSLTIVSPSASVREVLEVTHVNNSIPVYADEAKALASLRGSAAHV